MIPSVPYKLGNGTPARILHQRVRATILVHGFGELKGKKTSNDGWGEIVRALQHFERGGDTVTLDALLVPDNSRAVAIHSAFGRALASFWSVPLVNALFAYPTERTLEESVTNVLDVTNNDLLSAPTEKVLKALPSKDPSWLFGEGADDMKKALAQMPVYGPFTSNQDPLVALIGTALFLANYVYHILPRAHIGYTQISVRESYDPANTTLAEFPIHPFARGALEMLHVDGHLKQKSLGVESEFQEDALDEMDVDAKKLGPQTGDVYIPEEEPPYRLFWTSLDDFMRGHLAAGAYIVQASSDPKDFRDDKARYIQGVLFTVIDRPTVDLSVLFTAKKLGSGEKKPKRPEADYTSPQRAILSANYYLLRSAATGTDVSRLRDAEEPWTLDTVATRSAEKALKST